MEGTENLPLIAKDGNATSPDPVLAATNGRAEMIHSVRRIGHIIPGSAIDTYLTLIIGTQHTTASLLTTHFEALIQDDREQISVH